VLRFDYGAQTHVGLVRDGNEDAGFAGGYLQLIADGVGGAAAGEVASATAAYVTSALLAADPYAAPEEVLRTAVHEAHRQLQAGVRRCPEWSGMATTLTAVALRNDRCHLVHVGDSRAYLLRQGVLTRLTADHTLVQSLIDEGRLTPETARRFPYRSVVVRSVNADAPAEPDLAVLDVRLGDRLLLCSDGLSDLVDDDGIRSGLLHDDPDAAAQDLVRSALEAGGRDNVTCLVADVVDGPAVAPDGRLLGALADPYLVVDPCAVRSARSA
jgi:protein phosphatase